MRLSIGCYALRATPCPSVACSLDWVTDEHDAEAVYRRLCDEDDDGSGDDGAGDDSDGDPSGGSMPSAQTGGGGWDDNGDMAPAPNAADELDVKATILTAARMAKVAGDKSALLDRLLEGELDPVVTWADVLRPVMTSIAHDDYSYASTRPEVCELRSDASVSAQRGAGLAGCRL